MEEDGEECRFEEDGEDCRLEEEGEDSRLEEDGEDCRLEEDGEDSRLEGAGEDCRLEGAGSFCWACKHWFQYLRPMGLVALRMDSGSGAAGQDAAGSALHLLGLLVSPSKRANGLLF